MKVLWICFFALLSSPLYALEQTPEDLANSILTDIIALQPLTGFAQPNDDVFLKELDVQLYRETLNSEDNKLKALVAIKAIRSMPYLINESEASFIRGRDGKQN